MQHRYHYSIALVGSAVDPLTYHDDRPLDPGQIVEVPLRGRMRRGAVLARVEAPDFRTESIGEVLEFRYRPWQLDAAEFVATYYFSSPGEALGLFLPFADRGIERRERYDRVSAELPTLSPAQKRAYGQLRDRERALLFGVTGSGKTELYIHRMAEMLEKGESTILLMPEISLTPQMQKRLQGYFGDRVAIWHSRLSKKRKEEILDGIYEGRIRIVAGARSALFVPLENTGLIIVDEEHDDSYKSMTRPRYHARDLALYLGRKLGAQVWLGSATPSLSSYVKHPVVRLKEAFVRTRKRYRFVPGRGMGPQILTAIEEKCQKAEQSLIFVPTRANFKYLYCEACGRTHTCPYCSVGMSLHRQRRVLRCHYCNYAEPIRERCAHCGHAPLTSERQGTQEVMEILSEAIEGIRLEQFDRDAITTPRKLEKALQRIERGECDVIVGTQMLSKGHDYPNITLSVVTGLDYLLGLGDYRAAERAVSLLHQIAGRSGRSKAAEVIVQSGREEYFAPYLEDYERFLREQKEFARDLYPPFVSLARILIAHKDRDRAELVCRQTRERLEGFGEIEIVGAGPAAIERIAGKYRYAILLRSSKRTPLLQALHAVDSRAIEIDMDPVDFS